MEIQIQMTSPKDYQSTEYLTRETFWNLYHPGCSEHLILNQLRKSNSYIAELDQVAILNNEIIGHIISTKAVVKDSNSKEHEVLCVGPISVEKSLQNKGVGAKLLNHSISEAARMGFKAMILFGNPAYYHRFGFRNAQEFGITTKDNQNFEPFMALELSKNGLENITGRFFEDDAFTINENDLVAFEKQFPYKEKLVTDTQLKQ